MIKSTNIMPLRYLISLLLVELALLPPLGLSLAGQTNRAILGGFQGTWSAQFQGRLLAEAKLVLHGGRLSGSCVLAKSVNFNAEGALTAVSAATVQEVVAGARMDGGSLVLTIKRRGDTTRLRLRRVGDAAVSVSIDGVSMQPWVLRRRTARR